MFEKCPDVSDGGKVVITSHVNLCLWHVLIGGKKLQARAYAIETRSTFQGGNSNPDEIDTYYAG